MAIYKATVTTVAAASGAAFCTFHTGTSRALIWEISAFVNTAVAAQVGVGRPANTPAASSSKLGQALCPNVPASLENVDTAWGTAPTAPTNFLAQTQMAATIGTGIIWQEQPNGLLEVAPSSWITVWNAGAGAGPVLLVTFKWEI